jgi:hypothetical protein
LSKNPKYLKEPQISKQPKTAADPTSYHGLNPAWQIGRMELVDPFGWHVITSDILDSIRTKLQHFESMTWAEILVVGKKRNHTVRVDQLCPKAQKRLKELRLDDVDEVVSLHLTGLQRVWGILNAGVLALLWWDPDHEVCPSEKKNT